MKKIFVIRLFLGLILLSGCSGLTQVAQGIAENAPPAKTPELYDQRKLHTWAGDSNYYSDGYNFELYIKHGFSNKLILKENNTNILYFDGNDPNNGLRTVYTNTDLEHDTSALFTRTKYVVMPIQKTGGQLHGTVNTYSLVEESINPKYNGTSDQISNAKEIKVVVVTKPCSIVLFSIPQSVNIGSTADIKWRVNDCKKTELLENGSVIDEKLATGFSESIEGFKSITIQNNTTFVLRATNARGKGLVVNARLLATQPPPCPGNSNNGQPQYFTFCATCPGDYNYEQTVLACDEGGAKQWVQTNYSNCAVTSGICPRTP
ncbi:MAG: hypothetical protein ABL903_14030 [Methylococcales bacterium]